ncbi:MAG: hypothetical protein HZB59_03800 [Ignavibacteriales bacterium]|nr:hypothetical protein [Ignavibacteriales bacterium]
MKLFRLSILMLLFAFVTLTYAQIPRTLSYQGVLTDSLGNPKPDNSYNITFRLYDVMNGGIVLWSETKSLQVKRGLFSTILGDQQPMDDSLTFDHPYWLSLQVGTEVELSPRIPLTAVGYSLYSIKSDTAKFAITAPQQVFVDSARVVETIPNNIVTTAKIVNGTIKREDLEIGFVAPKADTASYALSTPQTSFVDSARISSTVPNSSITSQKILDGTIQQGDVVPTFTAPYADTAAYARVAPQSGFVDSARIAGTIPDNSVTGAKIANGTIQFGKIAQNGATTGQVMKWNGVLWSAANDSVGTVGTSSQWITNGSNIYYNNGNVGIGTSAPLARLHVKGANFPNSFGYFDTDSNGQDAGLRFYEAGVLKSHLFHGAGANTLNLFGSSFAGISVDSIGNVGIGTTTPNAPLSFPAWTGKKITLFPGIYGDAGFGVFGSELRINSDYSGADITFGYDDRTSGFTERMRIKGNGNVGIGTTMPDAPLGFPPVLGKKITLYPGATGDVGFGVAGNRLQIYSDNSNADVALGYDSAGMFTERFAVKANGAFAVNGNTGTAGQVLQSNGNSSAAQWQTLGSNPWQLNGSDVYYNGGRVGIGAIPSIADGVLDVGGRMRIRSGGNLATSAGLWLNNVDNTSLSAFVGMENDSSVGFYGYNGAGWSFGVNTRTGDIKMFGKLGIGTTTPNAPLGFPPTLGKKITLYPGPSGDHGIGVAGNRMQIYADNPNADVAIGYDAAGTFNERFAVKPNSALAVNGNTGTSGQVLTSEGSSSPAHWETLGNIIQTFCNNTSQRSPTMTNNTAFVFNNHLYSFTVARNSRLVITFNCSVWSLWCAACGFSNDRFILRINGADVYIFGYFNTANGLISTTAIANFMYDIGPGTYTLDLKLDHGTGTDVWGYVNTSSIMILPM